MKMLVSAANESVGKACLPSEIKNFSNPKERILVICIKNLKKKKMHISFDPATLLIGICPKKINGYMLKLEIM